MSIKELNVSDTQALFLHMAEGMISKEPELTKADQTIGDGDHGIGIKRGFQAVADKLKAEKCATVGDVLKSTGMSMMMNTGGAAGAIFGTLFKAGAKSLSDAQFFNALAFSTFLTEGLQGVKDRGKAKVGDKTMIDSLEPAALKAAELTTGSLSDSVDAAVIAARSGMESTKNFIATTGKAKTLGERSLGHPDPGSISMMLIIEFLADYLNKKN